MAPLDPTLEKQICSFLATYAEQVQRTRSMAEQLDGNQATDALTEADWVEACRESAEYVLDTAPHLLERVLIATANDPDDVESRPTANCGCGYPLIWIHGAWEHDAAPSLWGGDHDAHADEPLTDARRYWDEQDGVVPPVRRKLF